MYQLVHKVFHSKLVWKLYFVFGLIYFFGYDHPDRIERIDITVSLALFTYFFCFLFDLPYFKQKFSSKLVFIFGLLWNIGYFFFLSVKGVSVKEGGSSLYTLFFFFATGSLLIYPLFYALYLQAFLGKTVQNITGAHS